MKTTRVILSVALGAALLSVVNAYGKSTIESSTFVNPLKAVPSAEMPLKAVDIVKSASKENIQETAIAVTKASIEVNPASASLVVGALAKFNPELAGPVAGIAASLQPKQAADIARSAANAAPLQAGNIVFAVCRAVPGEYRAVASAVSAVAPNATKEIVANVGAAVPALKNSIQQIAAANTGYSVAAILDQATANAATPAAVPGSIAAPSAVVRGPSITDPFYPLTKTATNINPGNTGKLPPGGRDYSAP